MVKSRLALAALALLLLVCLATAMPGRRSKSQGHHRGGLHGKPPGDLDRERGRDSGPDSRESPGEKVWRSSSVGTRHQGRHEGRKLSRGRRATGIYDLLNRAGQWSYYIFQHFLPNLDCASLKARAADPAVAAGIAQACQGLGVQQHCSDISNKRQLPQFSPDVNCDVRTLAQAVYDNCCKNMYQPPRLATTQPPLYNPSLSQSVSCGRYMRRPLPRIVDGVAAVKCEFPWMAGLFKDQYIVNCGTSVVSQLYVATAAHCVKEEAWHYQVQAGKHFLDSRKDTTLQLRNVKRIIHHPDYTVEGMEFDDIALLELDRPLEFNECVQPVCLPEPGDVPADFQSCTVAGWGVNSSKAFSASQPDELQRVELTVYGPQTCRQTFRKDLGVVRDSMLCAANGLVGGKDACTGDSGGPLMCLKDNSRWVLQGIVSMGYGCALAGEPGYYTLVSHYRRWLDTYINARFQG